MNSAAVPLKFNRTRFADAADYLAMALIASLPWSTSATYILAGAWFVVLLPTLDWPALRRELATAAGALPVLLVVLAALGMLWADVAWKERGAGLISHLRFLIIPLLFVQFSRSTRGLHAIYAFLASCTILLATSYVAVIFQGRFPVKQFGVVVKDYISQSGFFALCAFLLVEMAVTAWRDRRRVLALIFVLLIAGFLANITYVITGRTALIVIPVLMVLFGLRYNWRGALAATLACAVLAGTAWVSSPYLRGRAAETLEMQTPMADESVEPSSTALRLAFWSASVDIIKQAPLIGHGTGTIRKEFQHYGQTHPGSMVEHATNPHQQTLATAMQLGLLGVVVLIAMWIAHALLFRGPGLAAWFGCIVVTQNIVSSLFNSHLYDFTQGWAYAVCVGIAGGMMAAKRHARAGDGPSPPSPAGVAAGRS